MNGENDGTVKVFRLQARNHLLPDPQRPVIGQGAFQSIADLYASLIVADGQVVVPFEIHGQGFGTQLAIRISILM